MPKAATGLLAVAFVALLAASASARAQIPPVTPATPAPPPTSVGPLPTGSPPPSTIPLTTREQSSHVSSIFAILSGVGAGVVLLIFGTQWVLTRPGRRRRWTL